MGENIIYGRVSTDEQAKRGISIPHQMDECRQYAKRHEYPVSLELTDDESGAHIERSGMDRLRELVRAGAVARVIVWRQDRLARDELSYFTLRSEFKRHGVEIHAVNRGGKIEGLYASLEAVLDADERERIRERTMSGRKSKAQRGKLIGHGQPPYGYIRTGSGDDIVWEVDTPHADVVRRIYHWYTYDLLSHADIAGRLTEAHTDSPSDLKHQTRRKQGSATWNRETVRWILRNPTYTGTFYAYRIKQPLGDQTGHRPKMEITPPEAWVPISVPAIIDQAIWDAAQHRAANAPRIGFGNARHEYLVARRVQCACGLSATGSTSSLSAKNSRQYPYYSCNSRRRGKDRTEPHCPTPPFRADAVDKQVWDWVRDTLLNPKQLHMALEGRARKRAAATSRTVDRAHLVADRESILARRDRLNRAYVSGMMTADEYEGLKREIDAALAESTAKLATIPPPIDRQPAAVAFIETMISEYGNEVAKADFSLQRFIIDHLDIHVRLYVKDKKRITVRSNVLDVETDLLLA